MTTFSSGLNANIPPQQKNVTQIYLDTTLKTFTLGNHLREGEARSGILTMVEDYEHFEFVEHAPARWTRNPHVFLGQYINIHLDKNGHYQVQMRKLELTKSFNAVRFGRAIIKELLTAKKLLKL